MKRNGQYGFTLVELLVVIVIIGMLMGMLIPAISGARARARQAECANNVKELGSAITQYQTRKQYFPGFCSLIGKDGSNDIVGSWAVTLLPYIQRNDLMAELRQGNSSDVRIDQYVCPSDEPDGRKPTTQLRGELRVCAVWVVAGFEWRSVCSGGSSTIFQQIQRTGIFADRYADFRSVSGRQRQPKVSIGDIKDGAAQTLLVSERVNDNETPPGGGRRQYPYMASGTSTDDLLNAKGFNKANLGFVWTEADDPGQVIRRQPYHISSNHPGGVNAAFCDGHVKSLNQDIDAAVYCQIMTPWGQGAAEIISGYDKEEPLNEGDLN